MNIADLYKEQIINRRIRKYKASYYNRDKVWLICALSSSGEAIPVSINFLTMLMHNKGTLEGYLETLKDHINVALSPKTENYLWFDSEEDCNFAIRKYVEYKYLIGGSHKEHG